METDTIKQGKMKDKIKKEYLRRAKKLLEAKSYQRNKYLGCTPRKIFGTIFEVDWRRT